MIGGKNNRRKRKKEGENKEKGGKKEKKKKIKPPTFSWKHTTLTIPPHFYMLWKLNMEGLTQEAKEKIYANFYLTERFPSRQIPYFDASLFCFFLSLGYAHIYKFPSKFQ